MINKGLIPPTTHQNCDCGSGRSTAKARQLPAGWTLPQAISASLPALLVALTVGACLHANPAQALEPMADTEMGAVTGQKGILLSLQYYYNTHPDQAGAPDATCSDAAAGSLADMDCRFATQLKNREDEWLVFKNGHASLDLDRIALDASVLGDSRGADDGTNGPFDYTAWFNEGKFRDVDNGSGAPCLLEGACEASTIANMAGLRLSYPEGENGANFGNVRFGMFFEGLAVEPNAGAPNGNGWEGNQNGSFMGLNIADNNGHQARIAFGGDFYLYGF